MRVSACAATSSSAGAGCIHAQSSLQRKSTFPDRIPPSSASTGISSLALARNLGSISFTRVAGQLAANNDTEIVTLPLLSPVAGLLAAGGTGGGATARGGVAGAGVSAGIGG